MARTSSILRSPPRELRVSKGTLDQRWIEVSVTLAALLGLNPKEVRLEADYQSDGVWAGLRGSACERAQRNSGGYSYVVPLCDVGSTIPAWLGIQEVWTLDKGPRPYLFRHLGLTFHVGFEHDPLKPQVLRLEWPGFRDWTGAGPAFQTPGAAHPHWQIDVLQSLAKFAKPPEFDETETEEPEVFGAQDDAALELQDILASLSIERMHLASAAPWWEQSTGSSLHANAPAEVASLSRWLLQSIQYARQELGRCSFRA